MRLRWYVCKSGGLIKSSKKVKISEIEGCATSITRLGDFGGGFMGRV